MLEEINLEKLLLGVDFSNLITGSFFTTDLINTRSINVNAVRGFFLRLKKLKDFLRPDYIVIATDVSRNHTFRRKLYSEYKANRGMAPDGLPEQIEYGLSLLQHMGYPIINDPLYEADDILGMVSRLAEDNGISTIIASSDRDFYQLVTNRITVFNTRKNNIIDANFIQKEYGLLPLQLIDVKALAGDKTDNIPGAFGIGDKTALSLLQKYNSLEEIYKNKALLPHRIQTSLENSRDLVMLSKVLATIVTDYSLLNLNLAMLEIQPTLNPPEVFSLLKYLELPSLNEVMIYSLLPGKIREPQV